MSTADYYLGVVLYRRRMTPKQAGRRASEASVLQQVLEQVHARRSVLPNVGPECTDKIVIQVYDEIQNARLVKDHLEQIMFGNLFFYPINFPRVAKVAKNLFNKIVIIVPIILDNMAQGTYGRSRSMQVANPKISWIKRIRTYLN